MWEDSRSRYITRVVKSHDRELYAMRSGNGYISVFRKSKRTELFYSDDDTRMYVLKDSPQFVFALTDNWSTTGNPVDWGGEVVLNRLKEHDAWNNEQLFLELEKRQKQASETKEKDLKNQNEAWLSDNHSRFKKAFGDIRTANFDKSDRRRRRFEKRQEFKG